ncbi:MAG: rod shape-determining protein MreD [Proteobacteria bacterium]|nr:rod shape-determining protein MreD [Pseudomonadota bacterium]MDA1059093.1 rod shape-determining protein MreD [Pseudomonadota bacterium]
MVNADASDSIGDRLAQVARNGAPGLLALLFVLLTLAPYNFPGSAQLMPPLALMAVFHWGVYRPDLLPAPLAFVLGLLQDILSGGPLGMWAAMFFLVLVVMTYQRRFFLGKKFVVEWLGFALVTPVVFFAIWLIGSFYVGAFVDPGALVVQAVVTAAFYPVMSWLMSAVRRLVGGI